VANIGQQLPNTDAKVFEVRIELNEQDTILRPSMTTSNEIITQVLDSVLFVPLEAVHANDSVTYVYTRSGEKQIVVLGESNENQIIVEMGLKRGDRVYLSVPENEESYQYTGLALMEEIKQRKAEEEQRLREQREKSRIRQEQRRNSRPGPNASQFRRPNTSPSS
jgi:hypothetical protein